MKSTPDCIHCHLKQAIICMKHSGISEVDQPQILYLLMDLIKTFDMKDTPCYNATFSILRTYELCGNADPFADEKNESNKTALRLLENTLCTLDKNNLYELLKLSSAGNIIDMGITADYDIEKTLDVTLKNNFSVDHYSDFLLKLEKADTVLYIGDNCGEILFDLPVVRFLYESGKRIRYAVKSAPILNDALYEDAIFAGINKYAEIIETGSGFLGVSFENSSSLFLNALKTADLVIAKGHANFESLDDYEDGFGRVFFILKIKCIQVAKIIKGSRLGDSVLYTIKTGVKK